MTEQNERFLALYHESKNKLFTYLMVRLNFNRALAEDILMDVVLKAYQNFQHFNPQKGSFKTWIFTLCRNHLINHWRDHKKTESLEALEEKGVHPAFVHSGEQADRQIENKKIRHILSLMKEADREIISLRYFEELEYEEIAYILGKKQGAIRTSLSRALNHFGKLYKKMYPKK